MYVSPRDPASLQTLPTPASARSVAKPSPASAKKVAPDDAHPDEAPVFPRSLDLSELASRLEPPERARQLALALEGPGVPIQLKLATLRMMLEGPSLPRQGVAEAVPPNAEAKPTTQTADPNPAVGAQANGNAATPRGSTGPTRAKATEPTPQAHSAVRRGSVIPPTLAAHVQKGGPGTPVATEPKAHLDLKG